MIKLAPDFITIAMAKDPASRNWLAEIHIEYQKRNRTDRTTLRGDDAIRLLRHCHEKLQKKLEQTSLDDN